MNPHRLSIAPMMDWTTRHCRYFLRLISARAVLYTEMVTTGALIHGDVERHLRFSAGETPLVLQLGGSEPDELAACARLAQQWGYSEVNLNVGCPSDRVQSGRFGACLMKEPELVAHCVGAMRAATSIPVTVKTRLGVDEHDSDQTLDEFISTVADGGCEHFILHARKAWLSGLSPRENREIPPLQYARVFRAKALFPQLKISLNGGVTDLHQARSLLNDIDGIMIGRAAYQDPWCLAQADQLLYEDPHHPQSREAVIHSYLPYVEQQRIAGVPMGALTRHLLGLFNGCYGARAWRRTLSEGSRHRDAGPELLLEALERVTVSAA